MATTAKEKITLTLPSELMAAVREIAPPRGHSQFIAQAIELFLKVQYQQELEARLSAGYQANAARDAAIANEWEAVEDEVWNLEEETAQ